MLNSIGYVSHPDEPKILMNTWQEIIQEFELVPIASCECFNPFTKEPTTLDIPLELAAVVVHGRRVGVIRWCSRGEGLDVLGNLNPMTQLAKRIAARIGGEFKPL